MITPTQPTTLYCEALEHPAPRRATHIYGPECEAETGKLMYLCAEHAQQIEGWIGRNPSWPVNCPTHGTIGKVKTSVILRPIVDTKLRMP